MIKQTLSILVLLVLMAGAVAAEEQAPACADEDITCWMKLLERDDPQAMRAAMQLGNLQSAEAVPALIEKLASKDQYMATAALHALIKIGKPAVLELVKATKHKKASVRRYATYALGRIGNGDAYDAVVSLIKDEDPTVRLQAAQALGVLKDQRALLPLFELLRDQHVSVRVEAARSLGIFADKRTVHQLIDYGICDLSPEVGRESARALVAIGEPAVTPLRQEYSSCASYARKRILIALGNIAATATPETKKKVVDMCIAVVKRRNENMEVRSVAAFTLGSLEAQDAVPALQEVLAAANPEKPEEKKLAAACQMALDKINKRPNPSP